MKRSLTLIATACAALAAQAAGTVGTSFPSNFPVIEDATLQKPVIGFGAAGTVTRVPVILLHGNNDVPYGPGTCQTNNGKIQVLAQYLADNGYSTSELWGLGYQGDQCELAGDQTFRSRIGHTNQANVPDLRRFVAAVMAYTGASQVDIVGHSLGATLAREWMRQDRAYGKVRRFVSIDGPHHGIINCSADPLNFYQLPAYGAFTPNAEVCKELGSPNTPFLKQLNGPGGAGELAGPVKVLAIRNADTSFVYFPTTDGLLPGVPAIDIYGAPTDFSQSAALKGAKRLDLTGQGAFDPVLGTAHLGILNSPATWQATLDFLSKP